MTPRSIRYTQIPAKDSRRRIPTVTPMHCHVHPPRLAAAVVGIGLVLLPAGESAAAEHLIDDFESADAPSPWVFSNGPEFPGATGSLSSGPGHQGTGARLAYDISNGGNYVAATRSLDSPVPAKAIAVWVKNRAGVRLVLRVVDDTGQTHQFRPARPLYASDTDEWYEVIVPIGSSTLHWGGADDGLLHGAVHAISVLASDGVEPTGVLDFDDVRWLDDVTVSLDPGTLARVPAPSGLASLRDRLGANIHFTSDDLALDALRDAGFGWVRMDLFWSAVETTQGGYDFSAYDGLVDALEARGMRAHFILCYGHSEHASGPGWAPQTPEEIAAFGDYVQAAAQHYASKPVQFEVWNEANLDSFWKPEADVSQYAALAKEAVGRVHAGNPSALVSTTGTAGFDFEFLRSCLALGCADDADAIGVHPYRQGGPESAAVDTFMLREIIADTFANPPPVWQTEWGYSASWYGDGHAAGPRHRQAVFASREVLTSWALGFPLLVYYDVRDDGTDPSEPEHNFGLLANDYSRKRAIDAIQTLSDIAAPRSLAAFGVAAPAMLHILELESAQDWVYAIWNSEEGATQRVAVPANAWVQDMYGNALPLDTDGNTPAVLVEEASGPVYVFVPKPSGADAGTDATADAGPPEGGAPQTDAEVALDASGVMSDGAASDSGATTELDPGTRTEGDDGCGCRTGGHGSAGRWYWFGALAGLLAWIRRRR